MSKTIDEKVVKMTFDNKQFEDNVKTTMSTTQKLKEALQFKNIGNSLSGISSAISKINFNPLSSSVDSVRVKFSALEVAGMTAISNITNSVMAAGKNLVNAFTLEPVMSGFKEYETQINAVQTILANTSMKGTTIDQVNDALNELNHYADKTIYNFTEMTRNIGTFTAAGVGLKESVADIKGIANLAALSGSNSQQASTAMYQLSQAVAAGTVKLQDWNSVVNAGMGGEVFQNALKETARVHNVAIDDMISKEGSFRETLQNGWLTSEILSETLAKFTGDLSAEQLRQQGYTEQQIADIIKLGQTANDAATKVKTFTQLIDTLKEAAQSGWTQTWQIIFGDYEEAKELFTYLSDTFSKIINDSSDARNAVLGEAFGGGSSKWEEISKQVSDCGINIDEFKNKLIELGKSHGYAVDEMISKNGSFEASLKEGWLTPDIVVEGLQSFIDKGVSATETTGDLTKKLEDFQSIVDKIWNGSYKNGEERIQALTQAGYDYDKCQSLVNKSMDGHRLTLEDLSDAQLVSIGYTEDEISKMRELSAQAEQSGTSLNEMIKDLSKPSGRELFINSIKNTLEAIGKIMSTIGGAWRDIFAPTSAKDVYGFLEGMNKLTKSMIMSDETADKLRRTLAGLFSILHAVSTVTGGVLSIGFKLITHVLKLFNLSLLDVTSVLGDVLKGIDNFIFNNNIVIKVLDALVTKAIEAGEAIYSFVKYLFNLSQVQNGLEAIGDFFNNLASNISDYLTGAGEAITDFIDVVKSMGDISFDDIPIIFKVFKDTVVDYFSDFGEVWDKIIEQFNSFKDGFFKSVNDVDSKLESFKKRIFDFCNFIRDKIGSINMGNVLALGLGAGLFKFILKMSDAVEKLGNLYESIGSVFKNVSGVIKSASVTLQSFATKVKAEALLSVAKSIAILVGSLVLLTQLDQDKLWSALGVLGALSAGLVALSAAFGLIDKFGKIGKSSVSIVSLSTSLILLATALKIMDGIDSQNVTKNMGSLVLMASTLALVSAILGKISPGLSKGSGVMIGLAVALRLMVSSLKTIGKMDSSTIKKSLGVMITMMASLGLLTVAMGKISSKNFGSGVLAVIGVAVALRMMLSSMKSLAKIDSKTINQSLKGIVPILMTFAAVMVASKYAGKYAKSAGVSIIAVSASMIIMSKAIKLMASIPQEDLTKASKVIAQIMIIFGAIVAVSKFAGANSAKAGVMLLSMSGAMLILSGCMVILSNLDDHGLNNAVKAISTLELLMGMIVGMTHFAKSCGKTMTTIAVTIGLLTASIGALAMMDNDSVMNTAQSLSMVMGMFSIMMASTRLAKNSIKPILQMVGVVSLLGGMMLMLGKLPSTEAIESAQSISLLLATMTGCMSILSLIKGPSKSAMISLGIMTAVCAGLGLIVGVLSSFKMDNCLETSEALSLLLVSLSGACLILSGVGMFGSAGITGVGVLMTLILGVGSLMAVLGGLTSLFPSLKDFVNEGIPLLESIGRGIGSFVGGIIGGFSSGMSSGLPDIGTHLSQFMDNVQGFISGASSIDSNTLNNVKLLADTILVLTASSVLEGISSFLGGDTNFEEFAAKISSLADGLVAFSDKIKGSVDTEAVESAANAGQLLATLASSVPVTGGLLQDIMGEVDLEGFSSKLNSLAEGIVSFSNAVKGNVDGESVEAAVNAGKLITELSETIPATGGLLQGIMGEADISEFSYKLSDLAEGIVSFSNAVKGNVDGESVEAAVNAGKMLTTLAESVPLTGGLLQGIMGEADLEGFSENIVKMGSALTEFSALVKGNVDEEAVEAAVNAGRMLTELASAIPESGGILSFFTGESDLGEFSGQLVSLGSGLAGFGASVSGVDFEIVNTAIDSAHNIATFISETTIDSEAVTNLSTTLSYLGSGIASYYSNISGVDFSYLDSADESVHQIIGLVTAMAGVDFSSASGFANALSTLGSDSINGFINSFNGAGEAAVSAVNSLVSEMGSAVTNNAGTIIEAFNDVINKSVDTITAGIDRMRNAGSQLAESLRNGIQSGLDNVGASLNMALNSCVTTIYSFYSSFKSAGEYIASGLAQGISNGTSQVTRQARAMASAAAQAARDELDIHSPSRVFYGIGDFAGMGFINALRGYITKSAKMGKSIGDCTIESLKSAVASIYKFDLDSENIGPTIRPVMDMSNVQNGLDDINELFNKTVNASIRHDSYVANALSYDNSNQNYNNEILKALNNLTDAVYSTGDVTIKPSDIYIDVEGRAIARASAKYMQETITKMNNMERRRRGIK